jgi:CDGSH-type Zn-finger protein/uncharacterized Fe-S cluster protein YjdI
MNGDPKAYPGASITVRYDAKRCIHAAECVQGLPAVFDTSKRPWVDPDRAPADEIARVVQRCPSGALTFQRRDGGPGEPVPERNLVQVDPDGPLHLRGDLEVDALDGTVLHEGTRMTLCRCGGSQNKPFCDNSHVKRGFRDEARVAGPVQEPPAPSGPMGRLVVVAGRNGPLLLSGSFEVVGSEGRLAFREGRAALCRCGHSQNKPLCDGSHKRAGFEG